MTQKNSAVFLLLSLLTVELHPSASTATALLSASTAVGITADGATEATLPPDASTVLSGTMALHDPSTREGKYAENIAQYLVDLHDHNAVFNFCGGMLFQFVLTDALRAHLAKVASRQDTASASAVAAVVSAASQDTGEQPTIFSAATRTMAKMPNYSKSGAADNAAVFHGREVRQVPDAAGGMHFVLQLSLAGGATGDPEGWTAPELDGYDGWGHDSSRTWRNGERLEAEGVEGFVRRFGPTAFTLNHRFYWHLDATNQIWLSAEDGCEGRLHGSNL